MSSGAHVDKYKVKALCEAKLKLLKNVERADSIDKAILHEKRHRVKGILALCDIATGTVFLTVSDYRAIS